MTISNSNDTIDISKLKFVWGRLCMSKDNKNENHYIGTFTILKEEIDGEIIHNKETGRIFLNLAKQ